VTEGDFQQRRGAAFAGQRAVLLRLLLALSAPATAPAHTLGQGYLFVAIDTDGVRGKIELTLTDLDVAVGLDADRAGKVSDAEVTAGAGRIVDYLAQRIGASCSGCRTVGTRSGAGASGSSATGQWRAASAGSWSTPPGRTGCTWR
jgi:hypothetical protein